MIRGLILDYLAAVFLLAVPVWVLGGSKLPLPVNLPVSALVAFVPALAAILVLYRRGGASGVQAFIVRAADLRWVRAAWSLPVLALVPTIFCTAYLVMRWVGSPLPALPQVPWQEVPVFLALYLLPALSEELGWTGLAAPPLLRRWGPAGGGLALGVVWSVWHLVPFFQTGNPAEWVAWQGVYTVALRMLIVWSVRALRGGVAAAVLVHTTSNVCWSLFPNYGSHYDPFVASLVAWLAVGILFLAYRPPLDPAPGATLILGMCTRRRRHGSRRR